MRTYEVVRDETLSFLGDNPIFAEYTEGKTGRKIVVIKCEDAPSPGYQSCATIGLNDTDIRLTSLEKSLRVEIVGKAKLNFEQFEYIMATIAFEIMESGRCFPGYIADWVVEEQIPDSEMKHVMLTDPFVWEDAQVIFLDDRLITWLMPIPISENEYQYACKHGIEELEKVLEEHKIDFTDYYRKSVI